MLLVYKVKQYNNQYKQILGESKIQFGLFFLPGLRKWMDAMQLSIYPQVSIRNTKKKTNCMNTVKESMDSEKSNIESKTV